MYSEVENNAGDAYLDNATAKTIEEEYEELYHNMHWQIVRHIKEEEDADKSDLINRRIFKPTSSNATKWLRVCQKTCVTTSTSQNIEGTLKRIATQKFRAAKGKLRIWKQIIIQEVGHKLQNIKELAKA